MSQFTYTYGDDHDATFSCTCGSVEAAIALQEELQTISGAGVERDEDFVYFVVGEDQVESAIDELNQIHGMDAEEG